MKTSQKFLFSFLIAAIILAFAATAVLAQENTLNLTSKLEGIGGQAGFDNSGNNLPEIVGGIIQTLLSLIGLIFMVYIVYAGYLWLSASGEEEKITKAKSIIRGSVIGLIIVFAAYAITFFVTTNLLAETGYTQTP